MKTYIDLRSDTVTQPTKEMRNYIQSAVVGDAAYNEDITVTELEEFCANLFQKEASLFVPSGTMANQIAIRVYAKPGSDIISEFHYHINYFESAQTATLNNVSLNLAKTSDGFLNSKIIKDLISQKPKGLFYSKPCLIFLENTVNATGGRVYPIETLSRISTTAREFSLPIHIDGARILNASTALEVTPSKQASYCDSLSLCFAKGLGAPFGAVLLGNQDFIQESKKHLKWMGGALHQAGFMACAALYALKHEDWKTQLQIDHVNLSKIHASLLYSKCFSLEDLTKPETNILIANTSHLNIDVETIVQNLKDLGILIYPWTENKIRIVTHKNISAQDIRKSCAILTSYFGKFKK